MTTFNIPIGGTIMTKLHKTRIFSALVGKMPAAVSISFVIVILLLAFARQQSACAQSGTGTETAPPTEKTSSTAPGSPPHGKTIIVANAILSALPTVNAGAQATANPLASIIELRLEDESLTSLQANDFAGLSGLQVLSLTDSSLTNLPAYIFE